MSAETVNKEMLAALEELINAGWFFPSAIEQAEHGFDFEDYEVKIRKIIARAKEEAKNVRR